MRFWSSLLILAQADAILSRDGEQMRSNLAAAAARPAVMDFIQIVESGLCGLFFYVGCVLRALRDEKRYEARLPNVYLGGNGSMMLHWCDLGSYAPSGKIAKKLKSMIQAATGFPQEPFEIVMSNMPKCEVAFGLVTDKIRFTNEDRESELIAGEDFTVAGAPGAYSWKDRLTTSQLQAGVQVQSPLATLQEFLKLVDPDALTRPQRMTDIVDAVKQKLISERLDAGLIRPEPIFVIALKSYLMHKAQDWRGKYGGAAAAAK